MTDEHLRQEGVREFHLGDILSVTTDLLVSPRGIEGVYDILNYMTGDNLFTHQLPRASREARPSLLAQHPDLGEIEVPNFDAEPKDAKEAAVFRWLADVADQYGQTRPVLTLNPEEHEFRDPMDELADMVPPERIFVFNPHADAEDDEEPEEFDEEL